jgi:hypothetical protein
VRDRPRGRPAAGSSPPAPPPRRCWQRARG